MSNPPTRMTDLEFEDILALTFDNQRAEGFVLTKEEIERVRDHLRKQHGLDRDDFLFLPGINPDVTPS